MRISEDESAASHPTADGDLRREVIQDYRIAFRSRAASVLGQREVFAGRAKFGIFGDGKEVPQVALAKVFRAGDWRAGYYRDQALMLATGMSTVRDFFAQLYADADVSRDPASGGRLMNNHFATRFLDEHGLWRDQLSTKNSSGDVSAVGPQMAWMLGLAYASKLYRGDETIKAASEGFSRNGDEIVFGSIGDAATSEGLFFEAMNAAGVLQVPLVVSVWDDGYGISVPTKLQTTKGSISEAMKGFAATGEGAGLKIYRVRGWDYPGLLQIYRSAAERARRDHVPCLVHVVELTQPQGHSTSGSHSRYKTAERIQWEREHDCLSRMRSWLVAQDLAGDGELDELERAETAWVESERAAAFEDYRSPIREERRDALALLDDTEARHPSDRLKAEIAELRAQREPGRADIRSALVGGLLALKDAAEADRHSLGEFLGKYTSDNRTRYSSHLYSESMESPIRVQGRDPVYSDGVQEVDGREILLRCLERHFETNPRLFALGEDVGALGDVNLVFEGLQAKHGELRVTDTGIREATILGQGIGAAMRGLRPIVDIQYLDYFLFALELTSDVLATLHHRTAGGQKAPVIIRTKGHRLQGVWHTGSPMAAILHSCRGMYLCVPRDMTRAAGMYNTLLSADAPALVVEVLNAYRLKESMPDNVGEFTVRLGVPEVLREGDDVTVVTYGALCRIVLDAAEQLAALGIGIEVLDVQTLNPFDVDHLIVESLKKTNAVLFLDEDVPGGASAFMMQQVLEVQEGWGYLDAPPTTLTGSECRSSYGSDGGYFTKPSRDDIVMKVYDLMSERHPVDFPRLW